MRNTSNKLLWYIREKKGYCELASRYRLTKNGCSRIERLPSSLYQKSTILISLLKNQQRAPRRQWTQGQVQTAQMLLTMQNESHIYGLVSRMYIVVLCFFDGCIAFHFGSEMLGTWGLGGLSPAIDKLALIKQIIFSIFTFIHSILYIFVRYLLVRVYQILHLSRSHAVVKQSK